MEGGRDPTVVETIGTKADVFIETGLTPEEYILAELDAHGGRLKQQTIGEITGWSAGAISRILTRMEEAETVDRVRLGRQKVVFLPGEKETLIEPPDADDGAR